MYKIYSRLHRKEEIILEEKCRKRLVDYFENENGVEDGVEKQIINMLIQEMPKSYAWGQNVNGVIRNYAEML